MITQLNKDTFIIREEKKKGPNKAVAWDYDYIQYFKGTLPRKYMKAMIHVYSNKLSTSYAHILYTTFC